jgi:hypothetical protein
VLAGSGDVVRTATMGCAFASTTERQQENSSENSRGSSHKPDFDSACSIIHRCVSYNFSGEQQFIDDRGDKGERLDAKYDNRAMPVVRGQLSKGGIRLAAISTKR